MGSLLRSPHAVRLTALVLAFPGSMLLTQCKTGGKSVQVGRYTQATLRTPAGHGMERKDYPFDVNGKYRVDWVKNNTRGKDPSAHGSPSSVGGQYTSGIEVASTRRGTDSADSPPNTAATLVAAVGDTTPSIESGDSFPPTPPTAFDSDPAPSTGFDSAPAPSALPAPAPAPAPTTRYHRVVSGDTLYGLSQRYGTSVSQLQRTNGLSGNTIRVGQSLRIP